jgi:hypothetical protein
MDVASHQCLVIRLSINLYDKSLESINGSGHVCGTSDASETQSGLIGS